MRKHDFFTGAGAGDQLREVGFGFVHGSFHPRILS
jgi:hypothetical protein